MAIRIGIGSWADPEYTGILYPKGVTAKERLPIYATWFNHVEINSSYYALPRLEAVREWVTQTPPDFTFDVKLHREFSHSPRKAGGDDDLIGRTLAAMEPLIAARKFSAFLLTLEPGFVPERHRLAELDAIVERLGAHRLAVELRHSDWVSAGNRNATLEYFRTRKLVWVAVDMPRIPNSMLMPPVDEVTCPELACLRLHGHNPKYLQAKTAEERHLHEYTAPELTEIVTRVKALASQAKEVHVVANNHACDFAPKAALALKRLLGLPVADAPREAPTQASLW